MRAYTCRTAYPVANLDIIEKSYDSVIIPTDRKCHYKAAIGERNKWLTENCDMMIVYIKRDYVGAYKCYKYTRKLGVPIMNIADNIKKQEWQMVDSKRFDFSFMGQNGLKKSEKYSII